MVVRAADGTPAVIANAPFLDDGTPMPTRYWLCDPHLREAVSRLESTGGVRAAEAEVPADRIAAAHAVYAAERDALIDPGHVGPRPSGGVGGTRDGRQVPARPPGLVADRGRRPGGGVDGPPDRPPPGLTSQPGPTGRTGVAGAPAPW